MTEQTSTATCKFPGCENAPEPASRQAGPPAGVLRRSRA